LSLIHLLTAQPLDSSLRADSVPTTPPSPHIYSPPSFSHKCEAQGNHKHGS